MLVLALTGMACSSKSTDTSTTPTNTDTPAQTSGEPAAAGKVVDANDKLKFEPASLTVKVGDSVEWKNVGSAPHTVTFLGGVTFGKDLPSKGSVSYTFTKAGTQKYHCKIHPGMEGEVVVE